MSLLTALILAAPTSWAKPPPPQGGAAPPHEQLLERADALGISPSLAEEITSLAERQGQAAEDLKEELEAAHGSLRSLLDSESPDRAEVMEQIEAIGALEIELHKLKVSLMLDIREQLTPEQVRALQAAGRLRGPGHRR